MTRPWKLEYVFSLAFLKCKQLNDFIVGVHDWYNAVFQSSIPLNSYIYKPTTIVVSAYILLLTSNDHDASIDIAYLLDFAFTLGICCDLDLAALEFSEICFRLEILALILTLRRSFSTSVTPSSLVESSRSRIFLANNSSDIFSSSSISVEVLHLFAEEDGLGFWRELGLSESAVGSEGHWLQIVSKFKAIYVVKIKWKGSICVVHSA